MTMTNFMAVTAILSLLLLMLFDMTRKKKRYFDAEKGLFRGTLGISQIITYLLYRDHVH